MNQSSKSLLACSLVLAFFSFTVANFGANVSNEFSICTKFGSLFFEREKRGQNDDERRTAELAQCQRHDIDILHSFVRLIDQD